MKKKINGQHIKFIINMIGLAVFAFSYLYIYTGFEDKTKAAYDQIASVKETMKTIEEKAAEEDTVLANTQAVQDQIQSILSSYPVDITKVDNLLFVEKMGKDLGIGFSSVTTSDSSPFYQTVLPIRNSDGTEQAASAAEAVVPAPVTGTDGTTDNSALTAGIDATNQTLDQVDAAASGVQAPQTADQIDPATATTMVGTQSSLTMNFTTSYDGFKKLVDYINNYPDKTEIDSVSVSKDSTTGLLSGSLVLKRYALTGTGKAYEAPVIDNISIGTDNIFGTGSPLQEDTVTPEAPSDPEATTTETP